MLPDSTVMDPKKAKKKKRNDKGDDVDSVPVKKMKRKPEPGRKKVNMQDCYVT